MVYMLSVSVVLAVACAIVYGYRGMVARQEDDYVHLSDSEAQMIPNQVAVGKKLDVLDRWTTILTVLVAVAAVSTLGMYLYVAFVESGKLPG